MDTRETLAVIGAVVKVFSIAAWVTANVLVGKRANTSLLGRKQTRMIGARNNGIRRRNKIQLMR